MTFTAEGKRQRLPLIFCSFLLSPYINHTKIKVSLTVRTFILLAFFVFLFLFFVCLLLLCCSFSPYFSFSTPYILLNPALHSSLEYMNNDSKNSQVYMPRCSWTISLTSEMITPPPPPRSQANRNQQNVLKNRISLVALASRHKLARVLVTSENTLHVRLDCQPLFGKEARAHWVLKLVAD